MDRRIAAYAAIFNALMIVAFILSNMYMWDFFNTHINKQGYRDEDGSTVIPFVWINSLQISVGHDAWIADGVVVPTALPTTIPNYPFILFWASTAGNIVFIALLAKKTGKWQNREEAIDKTKEREKRQTSSARY